MASADFLFPTPYPTAISITTLQANGQDAEGSVSGSGANWTLDITEETPGLTYQYVLAVTFPSGAVVAMPSSGFGTVQGTGGASIPVIEYTVVLGTNYQTVVPIVLAQAAGTVIQWNFVNADNEPVSLDGKIIQFTAWQSADGGENKQQLFQYGTGSGQSGMTIVGSGSNGIRVTFDSDDLAQLLNEWSRYNIASVDDDDLVIASGPLSIAPAFQ